MPRPAVAGRGGGPRLLSLAELEELRDDLADRVADARRALSDRTWVEEQNRRLIEEMLLAPERHKWVRVSHEDIGEPGCSTGTCGRAGASSACSWAGGEWSSARAVR